MSLKRTFSLKFLIGSSFAFAVLPLFLALIWGSFSLRDTSALNKQTSVRIFEQTKTLSLILQKVADVERKARLFVLLSDPALRQPYERESYETARDAFHQALATLLAMRLDSKVALVANELVEKEKLIYQRLTTSDGSGAAEAALDLAFQGLRDSAAALSNALETSVELEFAALREQSDDVQINMLIIGVMSISFAALIAWLLVRTTAQSLLALDGAIDRFGTDDLTRQPAPDAPPDVREIAEHMEGLRSHITALRTAKHRFMMELARDLSPALIGMSDTLARLQRHKLVRLDADLGAIVQTLEADQGAVATATNSLMQFAELEKEPAGPMQLVNLQDLILQIINELQPRLKIKSLSLQTALSSLELTGWKTQLRDLVLELLNNAIAFSPVEGQIRVLLQADEGHLVLEIEDQGPGIPSEYRNWVFQPFFRYPYVTEDNERYHYGVGLAKAKRYVSNHGGIIEILDTDSDGPGTRIRVTLPQPTEPRT